jgi:hypothetical protein
MSLEFSGSCTANLLWFENGFQVPSEGKGKLGTEIEEHFSGQKLKQAILETMRKHSITCENPVWFRLDSSVGFNYLNIFKLKDVKLDGNLIKDLVLRIHLCNDAAEMKAKIVAIIDMAFKSNLSAKETITLEVKVIELERELCQIIYNSLTDSKFSLGGKNYECSIYSISSSSNEESLTLIETNGTKSRASDDQIESYRVLLLDGTYISKDALPHDSKYILDLFNQERIGKANIKLFDPDEELTIENANYEIENSERGNSFIIANLVKKDAAKTTTNSFLIDFLEST